MLQVAASEYESPNRLFSIVGQAYTARRYACCRKCYWTGTPRGSELRARTERALTVIAQAIREIHKGGITLITETEWPARQSKIPSLGRTIAFSDPLPFLLVNSFVGDPRYDLKVQESLRRHCDVLVCNTNQPSRIQSFLLQEVSQFHGSPLEGLEHSSWRPLHRVWHMHLEIQIFDAQRETRTKQLIESLSTLQHHGIGAKFSFRFKRWPSASNAFVIPWLRSINHVLAFSSIARVLPWERVEPLDYNEASALVRLIDGDPGFPVCHADKSGERLGSPLALTLLFPLFTSERRDRRLSLLKWHAGRRTAIPRRGPTIHGCPSSPSPEAPLPIGQCPGLLLATAVRLGAKAQRAQAQHHAAEADHDRGGQ